MTDARVLTAALAGLGAGLALAAAAAHCPQLLPPWCQPQPRRAPSHPAYVLLVFLKLDPAKGGLAAFKRAWAPLAAAVRAREPNCWTYELAVDEHDSNRVCIIERYAAKSDLEVTHNSGEQFKAFGKLLGEGELAGLVLEKRKEFYFETGLGYAAK